MHGLQPNLRTGPWNLTDLKDVVPNGLTVFSCFCCGGGSTMGYKLAGFNVLGGCEIDPEMAKLYRKNHSPQVFYEMPVQDFKSLDQIDARLFELDVLDGSPPCSSFSTAGNRDDDWGKSKKFREGQADQILDDLFFHFIEVANRLRPRMVVAENVKGLILGNARGYVKQIFEAFDAAGYDCQLFLFNSARMGVPQARERTVFIARRKDLNLPALAPVFNEPLIPLGKAIRGVVPDKWYRLGKSEPFWLQAKPGESFNKYHPKGSYFNHSKLDPARPSKTVAASNAYLQFHWREPRSLANSELRRVQSFPEDYDFLKSIPGYVMGMSVPPFMMQRIALALVPALTKSP